MAYVLHVIYTYLSREYGEYSVYFSGILCVFCVYFVNKYVTFLIRHKTPQHYSLEYLSLLLN